MSFGSHLSIQKDSSPAIGTLLAAKNILNIKNVTENASKTFYDSSELFDKLFTAYVILGKSLLSTMSRHGFKVIEQFNMYFSDRCAQAIENGWSRQRLRHHTADPRRS